MPIIHPNWKGYQQALYDFGKEIAPDMDQLKLSRLVNEAGSKIDTEVQKAIAEAIDAHRKGEHGQP